MTSGPFRVGLRVDDLPAATRFYGGLGFDEVGSVPDAEGKPVFVILEGGGVRLMVDALEGMPFPDTDRERRTRQGPRGLGVTIGLEVEDLEATYEYCAAAGCEVTSEQMDEAWGDRVFACLDPFGYEWEFSHPFAEMEVAEGLDAVRENWFGLTGLSRRRAAGRRRAP
jgi:uncharacterized glyoxalase superfamily protein PhnB